MKASFFTTTITISFLVVPGVALSQTRVRQPVNPSPRQVNVATVPLLPDLTIVEIQPCSHPDSTLDPKDDCYRLHVKNLGTGDAPETPLAITYEVLRTIVTIHHGYSKHSSKELRQYIDEVTLHQPKVPALKRRDDVWVSVPAMQSVIPGGPGYPKSELLRFGGVIDPDNKLAESNKSNNKFGKVLRGPGSTNVCDLRLGAGSKAFVVNNIIYANLFIVNYGPKGTCSGINTPTLRVEFIGMGSPPSLLLGQQTKSKPADWGTSPNLFQYNCDAVCQQSCTNPETSQCHAKVVLSGYKSGESVLGELKFYEQFMGDFEK